jgi:hypothetical protein
MVEEDDQKGFYLNLKGTSIAKWIGAATDNSP